MEIKTTLPVVVAYDNQYTCSAQTCPVVGERSLAQEVHTLVVGSLAQMACVQGSHNPVEERDVKVYAFVVAFEVQTLKVVAVDRPTQREMVVSVGVKTDWLPHEEQYR